MSYSQIDFGFIERRRSVTVLNDAVDDIARIKASDESVSVLSEITLGKFGEVEGVIGTVSMTATCAATAIQLNQL